MHQLYIDVKLCTGLGRVLTWVCELEFLVQHGTVYSEDGCASYDAPIL